MLTLQPNCAWAWSGVQFLGGNNIARRCKLVGVNFGLSTLAPQNYFDDNTIFGYSGDGIRLNGDRCEAVRNRITDGVLINSNHPDALQAFGKYNSTAKTYADLTGLVIEDNEFIEWTIRPNNPLRAKMPMVGRRSVPCALAPAPVGSSDDARARQYG